MPEVESAAEKAAAAGLRTLAAAHRRSSLFMQVAIVVKAICVPGDVAGILRSHAWMHAAEGVLYREAVLSRRRRVRMDCPCR